MKFSVISLAAFVAFFSHAVATPTPQGGLPDFVCGGPDNLTCPTGYRCCLGPLTDVTVLGTCDFGEDGFCPL